MAGIKQDGRAEVGYGEHRVRRKCCDLVEIGPAFAGRGSGCLGRLLGFAGGGLLVNAASVFRLDAHALHFRLDLLVGFLTDARELRRDARVGFRFDARDFFGESSRRLLRGGRLHRFGFGLDARHLFGSL